MPDPIPTPEVPRPPNIIIGETPIYLATPQKIGDAEITSFVINGKDQRTTEGIGSAVVLTKEPSRKKGESGVMEDKPNLNIDRMDQKPWDNISGVRWYDEAGVSHDIPKEQLSLTPAEAPGQEAPAKTPAEVPVVQEKPTQPPIAREVLETIKQDTNVITIVGLKAYETRALDLADRKMQKIVTPKAAEQAAATLDVFAKAKEGWQDLRDIGRMIWKQSIGGIYFHEKTRQYYLGMLRAAETPFAEESIRLAEARATKWYNDKLADKNFLARAGTRVVEWFKDTVGMQTAIQTRALEELTKIKTAGEIQGQEVFVREAAAVRARFGQDMNTADKFVRENLGEHLEILDPAKAEYQPIVTGIKDLFTRYANGDIKDKETFGQESKAFFQKTLKDAAPKVFAEAELYSSSLFEGAETIRAKMSHEAGITNIDEAMAGMEIRLAMGAMGEVTSVDPTAVQKGVEKVRGVYEWLNKKNILVPAVFNEVIIGSGVGIALSAANFLKTVPARALGGITGGALAGGLFAGWREYGQLHKDYLTHLRERESGSTFSESMKQRGWFEKYMIKQRGAEEMIHAIRDTIYEADGTTLKATLTDSEVRTGLATIADTQARKAVSETGPKHIGLIRYRGRETIETERAALDLTAAKALGDLENYLSAHTEQSQTILGGNNYGDFMQKLTVDQTRILRDGAKTLESLDDPVKGVLGLVSSYAPEAEIIKRRWPFASRMTTADEKAMGVDAILEEFKKEARVEAIKYGVKAGVIGASVGVALRGVAEIFSHGPALGAQFSLSHRAELASPGETATKGMVTFSEPSDVNTVTIDNHQYILPKELTITSEPNNTFDAVIHLPNGANVTLGDNVTKDQLFTTLHSLHISTTPPQDNLEVSVLPPHEVAVAHLTGLDGKPVTMTLPEGYQVKYIEDFKDWSVLDKQDSVVASHLKILSDGSIQNNAEAAKQFAVHGLKFETVTSGTITKEALPATITATPTGEPPITISGNEMEKGGLWDYFLAKFHGENAMAATNGEKNLFRLYEHYIAPHNADGTPQNIELPKDNPYHHVIRLRDATFGTTAVKDVDLARIPNDATISLPKELFSAEALTKFGSLNDLAIHDYQELIKTGLTPMEALGKLAAGNDHQKAEAIILRLGYFGRDSDLPTSQADLAPLLKELGAMPPAAPVTEIAPTTETLHRVIVSATTTTSRPGQIFAENPITVPYHELTAATTPAPEIGVAGVDESYRAALRETAIREFPWFPIFIPLRAPLEAFPVEVVTEKPRGAESFLSPVGFDETYLTAQALDARLSPRLKEHADAKLSQSEEVAWYLATLSDDEKQLLASLKAQHEAGLAPETRAVVMIPTTLGGSSIYQTLTRYTGQVDKNGNPIDPKLAELVVFDYHAGEQAADNTKAEVDRFKAEHPDMPVVYLGQTYDTAPTQGKVKRDMSTFVFDRMATLPPDHPDIALVTNPNADIPRTHLSAIVETFDATPARDMVYGTYRLPQEAYAEYPLLFASLRAGEIFDALVRHGQLRGMPGIYDGNVAARAGVIAAVGGYNPAAPGVEDRELLWMVSRARQNNPKSIASSPDLMATLDPKEITYATLQRLGLADRAIPLGNNAVYRDLAWQEMAKKASEAYTKDHLQELLNNLYASSYPALKKDNPEMFDAYFRGTMDTLGLSYEVADGKIVISETAALAPNMAADIDVEAMAKRAVKDIKPPEKPREVLSEIAATEQAPSVVQPEVQETQVASPLSSPDIAPPRPPAEPQP